MTVQRVKAMVTIVKSTSHGAEILHRSGGENPHMKPTFGSTSRVVCKPANRRRSSDAGLMLGQRRTR